MRARRRRRQPDRPARPVTAGEGGAPPYSTLVESRHGQLYGVMTWMFEGHGWRLFRGAPCAPHDAVTGRRMSYWMPARISCEQAVLISGRSGALRMTP